MINILHLSETSEPGGSEIVLAYIAKNLNPEEYHSHVCLLEQGWLSRRIQELGIDLSIIENRRSYDPVFLAKMVSLIKREKIHLVHAHDFMMNVYGAVAAKIASVPMIATIHGKGYFTLKKSRILAYRLAVSLCSRMTAVSEDLKEYLRKELKLAGTKKIMILYNGIDLDRFTVKNSGSNMRADLGISPDAPVAGTVGSLFEVKGIPYLLRAVKKVVSYFPDFKLLIAGEGNQEPFLKQETAALGLKDNVIFLGLRDDIPAVLNIIDVYVCSSLSEGLSIAILEAMAMEKPVVATKVGGNPELIVPGENGYLIPSEDPEPIAEKIIVLLKDKSLREKMGKAGRKMVEEKFSLKAMIDNYQNLYRKLLNER
jgi:glycosyltransferase involved in cell wall biosynthesis